MGWIVPGSINHNQRHQRRLLLTRISMKINIIELACSVPRSLRRNININLHLMMWFLLRTNGTKSKPTYVRMYSNNNLSK